MKSHGFSFMSGIGFFSFVYVPVVSLEVSHFTSLFSAVLFLRYLFMGLFFLLFPFLIVRSTEIKGSRLANGG